MDFFAFYIRNEYLFAAVQLTLAMLGMGATLTVRDFAEILRAPRGLLFGFGLQLVGVPLIAWVFIATLATDPGVAIGLALCAAIAGGTTSNIFTYLARGNAALSIVLTTVSTLACLATTPLVLSLLIAERMPADFEMPAGRIAVEIGLYLLLPLALGMAVLRKLPRHADTIARGCIRASLLTVVLIVVGAHGAGRLDTEAFGEHNMGIVVAFIAVLTAVSALAPRLFRLPGTDAAAINIEIAVRNINLALLIKASLFPAVVGVADPVGDNVLFTALFYGGLSLMIGPVMCLLYRVRLKTVLVAS